MTSKKLSSVNNIDQIFQHGSSFQENSISGYKEQHHLGNQLFINDIDRIDTPMPQYDIQNLTSHQFSQFHQQEDLSFSSDQEFEEMEE